MKTIITILLLLVSTNAMAQQRTFYDASGRVTGRQVTHSNGSTTIYDASGRVTEREPTATPAPTVQRTAGPPKME